MDEWVLCFYYFMGISQNILIFAMKTYYERQRTAQQGGAGGGAAGKAPVPRQAVVYEMPALDAGDDSSTAHPAGDGLQNRRSAYAQRRQWFKRQVVK